MVFAKLYLANDGNYREMRYFTSWTKLYELEEYLLPSMIQKLTSQKYVSFGAGVLELNDTRIATECCEEEKIALGLSYWSWHYLRRSGAGGMISEKRCNTHSALLIH